VLYDAIEAVHESLCSVCQELFGDEELPVVTTAADTTPAPVYSRLKEGEIACGTCGRPFRSSNKNNGADCTACCNRAAGNGDDVFKKYGKEMTPKARERFDEWQQRQSAPTIAPIDVLPSAPSTRTQPKAIPAAPVDQATGTTKEMQTFTPATVPTVSAQPATTAAKSGKRAAKSDEEEITQQKEPTTKRPKTAQHEEITKENEHTTQQTEIPSTN
jgi:hypothetical protein